MKLWLVTRDANTDGMRIYDCNHGHVVRARNAEAAKRFAAEACADEGPEVWLTQSTVREIFKSGDPGIILTDFCAG